MRALLLRESNFSERGLATCLLLHIGGITGETFDEVAERLGLSDYSYTSDAVSAAEDELYQAHRIEVRYV